MNTKNPFHRVINYIHVFVDKKRKATKNKKRMLNRMRGRSVINLLYRVEKHDKLKIIINLAAMPAIHDK